MIARAHAPAESDTDDLFARFRSTRDTALRNRLVEQFLEVADRCARRYANRGEPLSDLTQVARLALVHAVERFDPDRGTGFDAFAAATVTGELRHHFRDRCWMLSVPRSAKELRDRVLRAVEQLGQELGRAPSAREIADLLGIDDEQVSRTIDSNRHFRAHSWEALGTARRSAALAAHRRSYEDDTLDRITAASNLDSLDERLRQVVVWRYWDELTQREIAARLGIGQVQVSRLLGRALRQMRSAHGPRPRGD